MRLGLFGYAVAVTAFAEMLEKDKGVVSAVVQIYPGNRLQLPLPLHYNLIFHPVSGLSFHIYTPTPTTLAYFPIVSQQILTVMLAADSV